MSMDPRNSTSQEAMDCKDTMMLLGAPRWCFLAPD